MPTQIITAPDIQDVLQYGINPNANYGAFAYEAMNRDNKITTMRWNLSLVPSGTITGFRLNMYREVLSIGSNALISIYKLKDIDTWVEGTHVGVQTDGESCWNFAKYNTQQWNGSASFISLGDADGPVVTSIIDTGTNGWVTFTLDPAIVNSVNGIVLFSDNNGYDVYYHSRENSTNTPYFEIDYTPVPGQSSTWFSGGSGSKWFGGGL